MGRREEKLVRALMGGATVEKAAADAGLSDERARAFLESVARFAGAVGTGMEFGLGGGAGAVSAPGEGGGRAGSSVGADGSRGAGSGASRGSFEELVIHTDGSSLGNPGPSGAGGVIETPEGVTVEEFHEYVGRTTNNVAEYEAVRIGLKKAAAYGARRVHVRLDSELVANQLRGTYKVKDPKLLDAYLRVEQVIRGFDDVSFESIPREKNRRADRLAQTGARRGSS